MAARPCDVRDAYQARCRTSLGEIVERFVRHIGWALVAMLAFGPSVTDAAVETKTLECPLRRAPYSLDTPLIDILMSSAARAAVESAAPGLAGGMTAPTATAPSVDAAHVALTALAARRGWSLVATDRAGVMTPKTLHRFDAVIWNNVSGDVLTLRQRRAFQAYVEHGGGYLGIHGSGGDFWYYWDWYADRLIGARFVGHPMNPQFQSARVGIEQNPSGISAALSPGWAMTDEWYSFRASPRSSGADIVAALDERSYAPGGIGKQDLQMGDHPIAWTRCVGDGRSFYSAIGHRPDAYADRRYVALLEDAVVWAAGHGRTVCRAGQEVAARLAASAR